MTPLQPFLKMGYGTVMYEFHYEYPINGIGVRQDRIFVVEDVVTRVPIIQWCWDNDSRCICNLCEKDITETVNPNCFFRKQFQKRSRFD